MATYRLLYVSGLSATVAFTEDGQRAQVKPVSDQSLRRGKEDPGEPCAKIYAAIFEVLRAKMILLAADGRSNDEIGASLGIGRDVVSLWRKRFFHERLPGLEERPRPGRPPVFPPRGGRAGQGHRV